MAKFRTRIVVDAQPQARAAKSNSRTILATMAATPARTDFRAIFRRHYERIRATCLEFAEPGVAVMAFELGGARRWAGTMCLAARAGEVRAGVVGRHSEAELLLADDPTVALRHLAVLLEPPSLRDALRGEVRFRVLDLNTGNPPHDEHGRAVESLTAEGPVLLTCQGYALIALVTGDPTDWPPSADDAWACLPERVFVRESLAPMAGGSAPRRLPDGGAAALLRGNAGGRTTIVRHHDGPAQLAARRPATDEPAIGRLILDLGRRRLELPAGHETLRRGLLVGRYDRCDGGGDALFETDRVSRVHLLVIEIAGRPYAVDLASTNGSFRCLEQSGQLVPLRIAPLGDGDVLALADRHTLVTWIAALPPGLGDDGGDPPAGARR